jgi:putative ABC transport system permease protein
LRADPQVESATIANVLPGNIGGSEIIAPEGFVAGADGYPRAEFGSVDDNFLKTYQVRLLDGRDFDQRDTAEGLRVAIVDREFVAEYWPDGQALGKRFRVNPQDAGSPFIQVVGVIDAIQLDDIDDPRVPTILVPMRQVPERFVSLAVRTRGEPLAFSQRLVETMRGIAPDTPLYWLRDFDEVARLAVFSERLLAQLFSVFGAVAMVLAAAGLYGLIAFNVGARTREIGLRRALGAPTRQVLATVLGRSGWQVGIGLVLGVVMGIPFATLLVGQLPGIASPDAKSVVPVVLILALTTAIAALVPARRAMRVDPMQALRYE